MHFVHQFQCFEVFLKCVFDFFKTMFFLKNFVCLCVLIDPICFSDQLKLRLKFLGSLFPFQSIETVVSVNRILRIRFLKIQIWLVQTTFSKNNSFKLVFLKLRFSRIFHQYKSIKFVLHKNSEYLQTWLVRPKTHTITCTMFSKEELV